MLMFKVGWCVWFLFVSMWERNVKIVMVGVIFDKIYFFLSYVDIMLILRLVYLICKKELWKL